MLEATSGSQGPQPLSSNQNGSISEPTDNVFSKDSYSLSPKEWKEFKMFLASISPHPSIPPPENLPQDAMNLIRELLKDIIHLVQKLQVTSNENKSEVAKQDKALTELDLKAKKEAVKKGETQLKEKDKQKKINLAIGITALAISCLFCPGLAAGACCLAIGGGMLACNELGIFDSGGEFDQFCEKCFGKGETGDTMKIVLRVAITVAAFAITRQAAGGSGGGMTANMVAAGNAINVLSTSQTVTATTTMICEAQGKDEEETQKTAMIANLVVTFLLILAVAGGGMYAGGAAGSTDDAAGVSDDAANAAAQGSKAGGASGNSSTTGTQAGSTATSNSATSFTHPMKSFADRLKEAAKKMQEAMTIEQIIKLLKGVMLAGTAVSTAGAVMQGATEMKMADMEKDLGQLQGDQELIKTIKNFLAALMQDFAKSIENGDRTRNHAIEFLQGLVETEAMASSINRHPA